MFQSFWKPLDSWERHVLWRWLNDKQVTRMPVFMERKTLSKGDRTGVWAWVWGASGLCVGCKTKPMALTSQMDITHTEPLQVALWRQSWALEVHIWQLTTPDCLCVIDSMQEEANTNKSRSRLWGTYRKALRDISTGKVASRNQRQEGEERKYCLRLR